MDYLTRLILDSVGDQRNQSCLFDIFVNREEYRAKKDKLGRFLYQFSSNKDVLRPVVSNYLVDKGFLSVKWPKGHTFAACLTHDVDILYPSWKYALFIASKLCLNLKPKEGLGRIINKVKKNQLLNPYCNFKDILKLEKRYGAKSSFYFLSESKELGYITEELGYITDMGWEIGLHGGYHSYNNPEKLKKEKARLEKILGKRVCGIRMHFLRFQVPDTWKLLADLGFKYDTTFGYPDMVGFRNGMCHPFKPHDLETEEEIDILEIPLIVMDATLHNSMHLHPSEAWRIVKKLIDVTEKSHGVITILWHNNVFDEILWGKWTNLYEQILKHLYKENAWMTSAEDIYEFWTTHVSLKHI